MIFLEQLTVEEHIVQIAPNPVIDVKDPDPGKSMENEEEMIADLLNLPDEESQACKSIKLLKVSVH